MSQHGLASRHAYAEVPPRVEYELTWLGRTLIEPIQTLTTWAEANGEAILDAQDTNPPSRVARRTAARSSFSTASTSTRSPHSSAVTSSQTPGARPPARPARPRPRELTRSNQTKQRTHNHGPPRVNYPTGLRWLRGATDGLGRGITTAFAQAGAPG